MEYHLEQNVVLDNEPKYKSLYSWSLSETGEPPTEARINQVPWGWSLYFTLFDVQLFSSTWLDRYANKDGEKPSIGEKDFIRAKLRSGRPSDGGRSTFYSMFGTDRRIEDITLSVYPALDGDDKICRVLGDVSYTTESDFRDETSEDYIVFAVYISAERFSYIASKIDRKALDGGTFRVDGVSGFYSDWSPSISTYHVKVLTDDAKNHPVEVPAGCAIDPPRLGAVGQFDLTLWSEPLQPSAGNDSRVDGDDYDKSAKQSRDIAARQPVSNTDAATLSILKSLRMAAWIIAGLLFVVAIK